MTAMKKVVITEFGDESKLAIVNGDLPDPSRGEVQLAVEYSVALTCNTDKDREASGGSHVAETVFEKPSFLVRQANDLLQPDSQIEELHA
jgi:hypothetical protein